MIDLWKAEWRARWDALAPRLYEQFEDQRRLVERRLELDRWEGEGGAPEPAPVERQPQTYDRIRVGAGAKIYAGELVSVNASGVGFPFPPDRSDP